MEVLLVLGQKLSRVMAGLKVPFTWKFRESTDSKGSGGLTKVTGGLSKEKDWAAAREGLACGKSCPPATFWPAGNPGGKTSTTNPAKNAVVETFRPNITKPSLMPHWREFHIVPSRYKCNVPKSLKQGNNYNFPVFRLGRLAGRTHQKPHKYPLGW